MSGADDRLAWTAAGLAGADAEADPIYAGGITGTISDAMGMPGRSWPARSAEPGAVE